MQRSILDVPLLSQGNSNATSQNLDRTKEKRLGHRLSPVTCCSQPADGLGGERPVSPRGQIKRLMFWKALQVRPGDAQEGSEHGCVLGPGKDPPSDSAGHLLPAHGLKGLTA